MKTRRLTTVLLLVLFSALLINTNAETKKSFSNPEQERTKTFNVSSGGKLYINVNPGNIKISAWDKNEVVVKVRGLENDELDNVEMELKGNTVSVVYNPEWGWGDDAEFVIAIPEQFNIEAKTSGGDVGISSNISGNVEISTMGGDISTRDVKGKAKLSTQGGDVKVGNIAGSLSLNTMGGDIKVGDVKGEFAKVSTMGGDITIGKVSSGIGATTYGGDISVSGVGGNADLQTMGGNIEIKDVNGKVQLDTKGGNISVKNANGSIKAVTYAGEIELIGISGSVEAKTMSGNINAEINPAAGSQSRLFSQSGEVELTVPSNAKVDIDAEIKSWGNAKYMKDTYSITSDFPEKESGDNNSKRSIKRSYSLNGGGSKISVTTTNGNIRINKAAK
jgi:DUF4097 and DUF4098 domain-containing protein YvlB